MGEFIHRPFEASYFSGDWDVHWGYGIFGGLVNSRPVLGYPF